MLKSLIGRRKEMRRRRVYFRAHWSDKIKHICIMDEIFFEVVLEKAVTVNVVVLLLF